MIEKIIKALNSAPYFSEYDTTDAEIYNGVEKLRELLLSRSEDDPHIINKRTLQNVWILTEYICEDNYNPYLIIRSNTKDGTFERIMLAGELFNIIPNEFAYELEAHLIPENVVWERNDIIREILDGRVRKIYDKEIDG